MFANRCRNGENVHHEPWRAIKRPYPIVEGGTAYGFDSYNDLPTGFIGADGILDVGNAMYKVMGCIETTHPQKLMFQASGRAPTTL